MCKSPSPSLLFIHATDMVQVHRWCKAAHWLQQGHQFTLAGDRAQRVLAWRASHFISNRSCKGLVNSVWVSRSRAGISRHTSPHCLELGASLLSSSWICLEQKKEAGLRAWAENSAGGQEFLSWSSGIRRVTLPVSSSFPRGSQSALHAAANSPSWAGGGRY